MRAPVTAATLPQRVPGAWLHSQLRAVGRASVVYPQTVPWATDDEAVGLVLDRLKSWKPEHVNGARS